MLCKPIEKAPPLRLGIWKVLAWSYEAIHLNNSNILVWCNTKDLYKILLITVYHTSYATRNIFLTRLYCSFTGTIADETHILYSLNPSDIRILYHPGLKANHTKGLRLPTPEKFQVLIPSIIAPPLLLKNLINYSIFEIVNIINVLHDSKGFFKIILGPAPSFSVCKPNKGNAVNHINFLCNLFIAEAVSFSLEPPLE